VSQNQIVPFAGAGRRELRQISRNLTRLNGQGQFELARIDQEAELQSERIHAVGFVTSAAMREVALLAEMEQQLAALTPAAANVLQGINNIGAISMADILADTVRKVR
jgi:hypothetical protein